MQVLDLFQGRREVAIIAEHVISDPEPFVTRCLRRQNTACLALGFVVTRHQAPYLRLFVAIDHKDPVNEITDGGLRQQWHDDQLVAATGPLCLLVSGGLNSRMQYCLQPFACIVIGKNYPPHGPAVQAARVVEYLVAKLMTDIVERRLSRCDDLSCDKVSVDDRDIECREHVGYRGLAARDATREADSQRRRI